MKAGVQLNCKASSLLLRFVFELIAELDVSDGAGDLKVRSDSMSPKERLEGSLPNTPSKFGGGKFVALWGG